METAAGRPGFGSALENKDGCSGIPGGKRSAECGISGANHKDVNGLRNQCLLSYSLGVCG